MDKPTTPDGQNPSPWPEESGPEQGFGATGVFRVVQDVKKPEPAPGPGAESYFQEYRAPEAPKPVPPPLAEPVVHKVVLGAGAESSSELLDRMRLASAERASVPEKAPPPAPAPGGQGSGGFTALLRTLESEPAPPAAAPKGTPAPLAQSSGFTSLLRTLDAQETTATPAPEPVKTAPPPAQFARPIPEEPVRTPAAPSPGGFTELLRTTGGDFETSAPPMQRPGPGAAPAFGGTAGAIPAAPENKPGAFTQLFSSFGGEASAPAPVASDRAPADPSRGNAGSFTRMLSLEPQLAAAEPAFREERKPLPGSVDYGNTPGLGSPAAANRDPFAPAPVVESKPADSGPPGGSMGITRLIQMLDEPTTPAAPRVEPVPASPSREPGPGAWTQTFAALSTPGAPAAAPAASTPAWPSPPQPMPAAPLGREAQFPGGSSEPPARPSGASGPSEFTRILDASRMRELAMKGGSGGANLSQAPPQAAAPPPPPAMPSYQVPPPPPMGGMGAVPHPGAYPPPPPQAPAYPMSYGPPGGGMPQAPGMYAPAPPPMPAAPPPPAAKPPEPGAGKMQMLVPILLIVIVVLLVVILLIFLLKR
jgi:hypothetical protein